MSINQSFRSLMFVPGHNQELIGSALRREVDVLLFDLEDSVQPESNKAVARKNVREVALSGRAKEHVICPRINDRESEFFIDDLLELCVPGVWGFMYPKAHSAADIHFVDKLLSSIEAKEGLENGTFNLIPLIETASAVINAESIARASSRVKAIAFGCEDFVTDVGGVHDDEGQSIFFARSMIVLAARSAGVAPIDTVHIKVHDLEDLNKNLTLSRKLGFEGMLVLHPVELDLVHQVYTPTKSEIESANKVIELAGESYRNGKGVNIVDSIFIGPPMIDMAKKTLSRAAMLGVNKDTVERD